MYLEFYGLKENPFNVTSDPSFLYFSKAHKEALLYLLYGIREKKGFLEITGEVGAGKTTLCKALLNQLDKNTKTAFILNSNLSELQLLQAIMEDFGLCPARRTKISFLRQLNNFLLEELKKNSSVVLILDEAQNLKPQTLEGIRLLSNLETDKEKLFQIILVGQPELRRRLNSPSLLQLRQRIGIRFHINPLEKEDIDKYIYHRLRVAGSDDNVHFTEGAMDGIFRYSGGIPRLINLVCDKALLSGFVLETKIINEDIIDRSVFEIEGRNLVIAA
ncbi:MAG: AAA family ATPase [Candidatus Omnitrophota bacterium]|nr:MAG: AAA family ATPase [Candidatus Omnitrophota bacterium]